VSGESQQGILTFKSGAHGGALALLSEPMVERAKKHVPSARLATTLISPSRVRSKLPHIGRCCEKLTLLGRGSKSSHQTHWVRWRQYTRDCFSQFEVSYLALNCSYHAAFSAAPAPWGTQQGCRCSLPLPLARRELRRYRLSNVAVTSL
jgi:hypothetical protein